MIDHIWRDRLTVADVFVPTRAGETFAPALRTLVAARNFARERAVIAVRTIRAFKEKSP